ncbi:hypothetical protein N5079_00505 [Planotetraspora sp. A-T 1434]|uniref:hypothetical protein n=1 Tax=Planotetraspora sp. A-T 1434 TaxID=2979219 RepID=UPI0021C16E94|nr:hypothetical protein [Planotetraspora sp. A-T 1434]MCT9928691.1 hypothetical protein [Planotetraspora sp. A-T 1434]
MKRTRLVVATATLAALAAIGTTSAAASGSAPTPGAGKCGSATVDPDGKPTGAADAGFAAVAAKLGVTTDRLDAALVAAKTSPATSTGDTPDAFVAAVAANLGLPVSQVQDALGPLVAKPAPGDDHGKQDSKDRKGVDGPQDSPFTTDAAAASVAAALGVGQAEAKAALTAVVALGSASGGVDPTSKAFGDIAASLGVSSDRLTSALADLKRSLANG